MWQEGRRPREGVRGGEYRRTEKVSSPPHARDHSCWALERCDVMHSRSMCREEERGTVEEWDGGPARWTLTFKQLDRPSAAKGGVGTSS